MNQLHLFPTVIMETYLEAESKKNAFWILRLYESQGRYWLEKESGAGGKILDVRKWPMRDRAKALHQFNKKVAEKLNPKRLSPRKYKRVTH